MEKEQHLKRDCQEKPVKKGGRRGDADPGKEPGENSCKFGMSRKQKRRKMERFPRTLREKAENLETKVKEIGI